jgi:hypothetical protein
MLSQSRLRLVNLLIFQLSPPLRLEVLALDLIEISSTNTGTSCTSYVTSSVVDSVEWGWNIEVEGSTMLTCGWGSFARDVEKEHADQTIISVDGVSFDDTQMRTLRMCLTLISFDGPLLQSPSLMRMRLN